MFCHLFLFRRPFPFPALPLDLDLRLPGEAGVTAGGGGHLQDEPPLYSLQLLCPYITSQQSWAEAIAIATI